MKSLEIVIPVYNEADGIDATIDHLLAAIEPLKGLVVSILVVDDGSVDDTAEKISCYSQSHPCVRLLVLTRNFGKEAAIYAGLQHTKADAAVVMDGDMQHPPGLLREMVQLWLQGFEVIEAVKVDRRSDSLLDRAFARSFYSLFSTLSGLDITNHSDFKLLDRRAIEGYLTLPERVRFFRGLVSWMGFRTAQIPVTVPDRTAGRSSWSKKRLLRYALRALTAFSSAPLYVVTVLGAVTLLVSAVFGSIALADKLSGNAVDGFTTVIILMLFFFSLLMGSLGMIGVYLSRIYDEVKARPIYLLDLDRSTGLTADARTPADDSGENGV